MDVKPYTPHELAEIMAAVEEYPNWGIYKTNTRERVRAFILTLRWTGMRIGDAIQLSRSKVAKGKITLRTEKNGKRVSVPMHPDLEAALAKIQMASSISGREAAWCSRPFLTGIGRSSGWRRICRSEFTRIGSGTRWRPN